eukprot:SAG31_NODE_904_length_11120_cov_76.575084_3_plen_88_part_00
MSSAGQSDYIGFLCPALGSPNILLSCVQRRAQETNIVGGPDEQLAVLMAAPRSMGMEPLVEVANADEMKVRYNWWTNYIVFLCPVLA